MSDLPSTWPASLMSIALHHIWPKPGTLVRMPLSQNKQVLEKGKTAGKGKGGEGANRR